MFDLASNSDLREKIKKIFPLFFGLLASLFSVAAIIIIDKLLSYVNPQSIENLRDFQSVEVVGIVFTSIIVAPLLETLLFQLLIIENIRGLENIKDIQVLVISALAFSCAHLFFGSLGQALRMIVLGCVLSAVYMSMRRSSIEAAFTATWTAHCSHNILILLIAWNSALFKT